MNKFTAIPGVFFAYALLTASFAYGGKVDVHTHAGVSSTYSPDAEDILDEMDVEGIDVMIMMTTPSPLYGTSQEISTDLSTFFGASSEPTRFRYMYGGAELNYLLHGVGRSTSFAGNPDIGYRWTATTVSQLSVYPNGCTGPCTSGGIPAGLTEAMDIETRGATGSDHTTFINLVTAAVTSTSPNYVGIGEISPHHPSQRVGHPFIRFPVRHTWMKEMADIAAPYGKVIDLHVELDATTVTELNDLLAHNRSAKFLLEHAGWSPNGYASASVIESLLAANTNLYIALKKCHSSGGAACYIDSSGGQLSSDWRTLLTNASYATRFMIGGDAKFWSDSSTVTSEMRAAHLDRSAPNDGYGTLKVLLTDLGVYDSTHSTSYATAINETNARSLFGIP